MKRLHKLVLFILVMGLLSLGCGLTDAVTGGGEEDTPPTEAPAEVQEQSAAAEPGDGGEQPAPTPAEAAAQAEAEAEEVQAEAEAAPQPDETEQDTVVVAEEAAEGEEAIIEFDSVKNQLQELSAYRIQLTMNFDGETTGGQPARGNIEVFLEQTQSPQAMHMNLVLEGDTVADTGGFNSMEVYQVENSVYMQVGEEGWISVPATSDMNETFSEGFFTPDEMVDLPETANRLPEPEMVNGISTWHYTFDAQDIPTEEEAMELSNASGDLWVAQEGNYPVKYAIEATGSNPTPAEGDLFASGTFRITYELMDINGDFTIEPPPEALSGQNLGGQLMGGDEGALETELPMMEDAEVEFSMPGLVSYYTEASIPEVADFYRQALPAQGWTADTDTEYVSEDTGLLSFTKDNMSVMVSLTLEEDGRVLVNLVTSEE